MFLFNGSDAPKDKIPSGVFYYEGRSGHIMKVNFKNNTFEKIKVARLLSPEMIAKIDDENFLFSDGEMQIFNLKTKKVTNWKKDYLRLIYFSKYNKFASGTRVVDFSNPEGEEYIEFDDEGATIGSENVKISDDEILISYQDKGRWIYNLGTKKVKKVSGLHCNEPIWRSKTKQLLCKDYKEDTFYLTSLDGKQREDIDLDYYFEASLYLEDLDAVIGQKKSSILVSFPDGRWDCWIYYFEEEKSYRLKKGCLTGGMVRFK